MTDTKPRTPLTLEFHPDNLMGTPQGKTHRSLVVCEPSFEASGHIFLGVDPFGRRQGVHLTEAEVRRIRDHLNVMLMEPVEKRDRYAQIKRKRKIRLPFGLVLERK